MMAREEASKLLPMEDEVVVWDSISQQRLVACVSGLAIVSKFALNAFVYLYAAGQVKTGDRHAIQTACSISDIQYSLLIGYAPGCATVATGLVLGIAYPLSTPRVLRDASYVGVGVGGASMLGMTAVANFGGVLVVQLVGALGSAVVGIATMALIGVAFDDERRPASGSMAKGRRGCGLARAGATGLVLAAEPIGSAAAIALQWPALDQGWRAACALGSVIIVIAACALWLVFPREALLRHEARARRELERRAKGLTEGLRERCEPSSILAQLDEVRRAMLPSRDSSLLSVVVGYTTFHASMDIKAMYFADFFDAAWPNRASAYATLSAALLVPVALAGPAGGGTVADSLARGLKDPRAAYATQTAVCAVAAVAASAAALFSGHFATSVGAAFVGILCDGFALTPLCADVQRRFPPHLLASVLALLASANTILASTLELAIGELDEDSDPLSSDIGLALTLLYLPALLANFYTLRAVLKERDAAPTA